MTSNPFTLIPASVRMVVYVLFAFLGLVLGGIQGGYAGAGIADPTWLHIAFAVFGVLAGPLGLTAWSNVGSTPTKPTAPAIAWTVNPVTAAPTLADTAPAAAPVTPAAPVVPPTTPPAA